MRPVGSRRSCRISAAVTVAVSFPDTFTKTTNRERRSTSVAM
jgi:hypothetical protein